MNADLVDAIKNLNKAYPPCPAGSDWILMTDDRKKVAGFKGLPEYQESIKILSDDSDQNYLFGDYL